MTNEEIKYSVVVPVFNSSATLRELIHLICEEMNTLSCRYEIILVDDDSMDDSWERLKTVKKESNFPLCLIRLGKNAGQFAATFCGVEHAKGEIVITLDDDLQYHPKEIHALLRRLDTENQLLVYGVPKNKKFSWKTKLYFFMMQIVINFTTFKFYVPKGFYYTSFRAFSKKKLWNANLIGRAQHFDIYAIWHLNPTFIGFEYVEHVPRKKGKSGQTFRKKSSDAILNIMCTFLSPLQAMRNLSWIFILMAIILWIGNWQLTLLHIGVGILVLMSMLSVCLYIVGIYLGRLHALKRGYQDYFVIEKI